MDFEYYVDRFDSLESVSKKFNVEISDIINKNNIRTSELPKTLIIPVKNKKQFSIVANFKREFLLFGNYEKAKVALNKRGLYCSNLDNDVYLFKPSNSSIYVVGVLDSLNTICKKFNIKKEEIIKINNLKTEKLFIGQIIKLC